MDENDILALLQGEEPTGPAKALATAAALRRQRASGMLDLMTGDRVLGTLGTTKVHGADAGEALLQRQANQNADNRRQVLDLALAQKGKADAAKRHEQEFAANLAEQRYGHGLQAAVLRETMRQRGLTNDRADAAEKRAEAEAARKAAKDAQGKELTSSDVEALSALPVALEQVDDMFKAFKQYEMDSPTAKVSGVLTDALGLQGTDVAKFNAVAQIARQGAGKISEGGKMTDSDEFKYKVMMPRSGDSAEVAAIKNESMKKFLTALAQRRAKGLKDSGYNVPESLMGNITPETPKLDPLIKDRPRVFYRPDGTAVEVTD